MSKPAKNELKWRELEPGKWLLFGWIEAKTRTGNFERTRIRERFVIFEELTDRMSKLKHEAADYLLGIKNSGQLRRTHISEDQLQDAHAAFREIQDLAGVTLLDCARHFKKYRGALVVVSCEDAKASYEKHLIQHQISEVDRSDRLRRIRRFLDATKINLLHEITHERASDYVMEIKDGRPVRAPFTQINDANTLTMWLKFCVEKKMLKQHPLNFNLKALREQARPLTEPEIFTPEQCQRLLDASLAVADGKMAPYVIVGLWSFLRPTEPKRLRPADFIMQDGHFVIDHRGEKRGSEWRISIIPENVTPTLRQLIKAGAVKDRVMDGAKVIERGGIITPPNARRTWLKVLAAAGLCQIEPCARLSMPKMKEGTSKWSNDILRHTGMSYLFQKYRNKYIKDGESLSRARDLAIEDVTTEAGNSRRTAYLHYLRRVSSTACDTFFAIRPSGSPAPVADVVEFKNAS